MVERSNQKIIVQNQAIASALAQQKQFKDEIQDVTYKNQDRLAQDTHKDENMQTEIERLEESILKMKAETGEQT